MPYWNLIISSVRRNRFVGVVPLLVSGAIGCSGNSVTCPQVVLAASPAVVIASVANKETGVVIAQFTLSNFTVDNQVFSASGVISGVPGTNASLVNGTLTCSGSCGFGGTEGTYTFTVSAAGRPDTIVTVAAKYTGSTGQGCSRKLKNGTSVTIAL